MSWFSILKRIGFSTDIPSGDAAYDPSDDTIYLGPGFDFDSALARIIHEETHAAQVKTGTEEDFRASVALIELEEAAKKYDETRQGINELIAIATKFKEQYLKRWLEGTFIVEIQAYLSENPDKPLDMGPVNSTLYRLYGLQEMIEDGGILVPEGTEKDEDFNFIIDQMVEEGERIVRELEARRKRISRRKEGQ